MTRSSAVRIVLPVVSALLLLGGCARDVLNPAGDVALQQRNLIYTSTGLMLLIIVPVMVLIVFFAWHYRSSNREATYDPNFDHSTTLELVIWSGPLLIIIALGALTWSSTHLLDPFRPLDRLSAGRPIPAAEAPLRVQVVSMDWKWLFIYPEQGIATVNELVLPVDRQVQFDITSTNMMNTFYAPTLAGMVYAMPGMRSQLHAVLNRTGRWEGFSANYSGAGFSDMRFGLYGVDAARFDQWVGEVKGAGQGLQTASYLALEKPSERVPPMRFSSVEGDLFDRVLNRCVAPGAQCMRDVMAKDRGMGGHRSIVPPSRDTPPPSGQKPPAAIQIPPTEIEPLKKLPPEKLPAPPGPNQPPSQDNRKMSALEPSLRRSHG